MTRRHLASLAALTTLAVVALPRVARATDCQTDADCGGGKCVSGECAEAETPIEPSAPLPRRSPPSSSATSASSGATATVRGDEPDERGRRSAAKFLITAGIGALGSGYILAAGGAGIGTIVKGNEDSKYGASCATSAALSFIPLVGPFLTLAQYPQHQVVGYGPNGASSPTVLDCNGARGVTTGLLITDEVIQLGGAAMAITGLIMSATLTRTSVVSLEVSPGAPGAPLGLSMRLVHF